VTQAEADADEQAEHLVQRPIERARFVELAHGTPTLYSERRTPDGVLDGVAAVPELEARASRGPASATLRPAAAREELHWSVYAQTELELCAPREVEA